MRLPMIMEDMLEDWEHAQKFAQFKAEYIITHGIEYCSRCDIGPEKSPFWCTWHHWCQVLVKTQLNILNRAMHPEDKKMIAELDLVPQTA